MQRSPRVTRHGGGEVTDPEREPAFPIIGPLTPLEAELVFAVEEGRTFFFDPAKLCDEDCVRGPLIRALMLGTPVRRRKALPFASPRAVKVTAHGIRIQPVPDGGVERLLQISGVLSLDGLAALGGGVLPPLELSHCLFREPICLRGARLQALTLRRSRFPRLAAGGSFFAGSVLIEECRPPADLADPVEAFLATHHLAAISSECDGTDETLSYVADVAGENLAATRAEMPRPAERRGDNPEPPGLSCTVDFEFATVKGGLSFEKSYFRALGIVSRRKPLDKLHEELAVDLSRIHVGGSIRFRQTDVIGFVKAPSASVEHDVTVRGGKFLVSSGAAAFDFQMARIAGRLTLQEGRPTPAERHAGIRAFPLVVVGQVWGVGLSAGEVWIGEGLYYGCDPESFGGRPTFYFSKANIAKTFKVGAYHEHHARDDRHPTGVAKVQGEICLLAASISKNLEIHGLSAERIREELKLDHPFFAPFHCDQDRKEAFVRLTGMGMRVGRRAVITASDLNDVARDDPGPKGRPAGPRPTGREKPPKLGAIDLWKSRIGIGLRISRTCSMVGAVRLNSCVIGREVIIDCKSIRPVIRETAEALKKDAPDSSRAAIPWLLDLRESTIDGHVKIGRRVNEGETSLTVHGGVTVENAKVQGRMVLRHVTLNLERFGGWQFGSHRHGDPRRRSAVALNMRDFECGSDLEVTHLEWKLPLRTRLEPAKPEGRPPPWWVTSFVGRRARDITRGWYAIVDLRGLRCGLLMDSSGTGWGLKHRIWLLLAGIRIGDIEPGLKPDANRRLAWLSQQNRRQFRGGTERRAPRTRPSFRSWINYYKLVAETLWATIEEDFVPQAYDAFASASRRVGNRFASEIIAIERKNLYNYLKFKQGLVDAYGSKGTIFRLVCYFIFVTGLAYQSFATWMDQKRQWDWPFTVITFFLCFVIVFWPFFAAGFRVLYRRAFRYGLSPDRALFALLISIGVGWFGVNWARNGGPFLNHADLSASSKALDERVALVLDVPYAPEPQESGGSNEDDGSIRRHTGVIVARPTPCNLEVSNLLYAIDVFVPVLDLDQERRCSIREIDPNTKGGDPYLIWRVLKALYEIVGWIGDDPVHAA